MGWKEIDGKKISLKKEIAVLIEQIREINHLIKLHQISNDDFMLNQYRARKNDFLKELVAELIQLDVSTIELYQFTRNLITKIEHNTASIESQGFYPPLPFSLKELEAVTS